MPTAHDVVRYSKARQPPPSRIRARSESRRRAGKSKFDEALARWLTRYGRYAAANVDPKRLNRFRKAGPPPELEQELLALLTRFGLQQLDAAGRSSARAAGGKWVLKPEVKAAYIRSIESKVRLTIKATEREIRLALQRILAEAVKEQPRPTAAAVARRIARQWHGPEDNRDALFSFARASAIARTELGDADTHGALEGYAAAGVEAARWMARTGPGHRHGAMNSHPPVPIADLQGHVNRKWFRLPSGVYARRPMDSILPVGERVNCECVLLPARL